MRRLLSLVRRAAPYLFAERGSLALTRALRSAGTRGKADPDARAFNDELEQRGLRVRGHHKELALAERHLAHCDLEGIIIESMDFARGHWSDSLARKSHLQDIQADGSTWAVIDLQEAQLSRLSANQAHVSLVSFRDALLQDSCLDGARLCLCDFSGATLQGVSMRDARLSGCDFEGAVFEGTNLSGADLSGCIFRNTWCGDLQLEGAYVEEADFRGAIGLSPSHKKSIADRGGLVGGGWTYGLLAPLLGRNSASSHPRILRMLSILWAFLALTVPIAFFVRAILAPIDPEDPPGFDHHEAPSDDQAPIE